MKLNEVLNLYGLHQNPEQLTGHDKIGEISRRLGKWAYISVANILYDGQLGGWKDCKITVNSGNSDAPSAIKQMRANLASDGPEPFTRREFSVALQMVDDMVEETYGRDHLPTRYVKAQQKFEQIVSSFSPATVIQLEVGYDLGVGVFEHPPQTIAIVLDEAG